MRGAIGVDADLRYDLNAVVDGREVPSNLFLSAADRIAPPIEVEQDSGHIPEIFAGEGDRIVEGERAADGSYPLLTWKIGDLTFTTQARGWEVAIDKVNGRRIANLINQEEVNAKLLHDVLKLGKEYRVATKANLYASYGSSNKKTIALTANNWYQGSKFRDDVNKTIAPRLFATKGVEKEQISAILPLTLIREVMYIDDIRAQMKYTTPIDQMKFPARLQLLADYLGVKEIIPVSGRYNTAHFNSVSGPAFSRLWNQSNAIFAVLSGGGAWDKLFMRQPYDTIATQGNEYMMESYDLPANDQVRNRIKHVSGETINYDCAYIVKDFDAIGT